MTLLVSLDSRVVADTIASNERGRLVEFPQLVDRAAREGDASSIEVINGRAYQLVVVPVLADLRTLRVYGCDQAQGYFMSRPLPAKELEEWLKHSPWSRPARTREVSMEETSSKVTVLKLRGA